MFAANILVRYSCVPRHGYFKTVSRAFGYFKRHPKGAITFDTQISEDTEEEKLNKDLKELYPHAKEKIPKDAL